MIGFLSVGSIGVRLTPLMVIRGDLDAGLSEA